MHARCVWLAGCLATFGCSGGEGEVPRDAGAAAPDGGSVARPDAGPDAGVAARYARVRILAFQEFQGQLEPEPLAEVGGGVHLATLIDELRAEVPNTLVVTAGDLTGASPLLSSVFHDEPTVAFANRIGLDVMTLGNTDLDRPKEELLRLFDGGCHPETGCRPPPNWDGADFEIVAANLVEEDTGERPFPAWTMREVDGARIGFVGVVPEEFRRRVRSESALGWAATESVAAVEAALPEIAAAGADVVVALVHAYVGQEGEPTDCELARGPGWDIATALPAAVQLVVLGEGAGGMACEADGRLMTKAGFHGVELSVLDLHIDVAAHEVVDVRARNEPVDTTRHPEHADIRAMLDEYAALFDVDQVVGRISESIIDQQLEPGQNPMGFVVADAYLAAAPAGTDMAFVNEGGVRASLVWQRADSETEDGQVRLAELADVTPFGNRLLTLTLTGAQVTRLLDENFLREGGYSGCFPSAGLSYRVTATGVSASLHGAPIEPDASYRVAVNDFLAGGPARWEVLTEGTEPVSGPIDLELMADYFLDNSPVSPPALDRVIVE